MAPLKIIGAGYGRTGTDSLRTALNILGYTTHHMKSYNEEGGRTEMFTEAYEHPEKAVDWDFIYDGFDAAVDWPTCSFLEPLMQKYPDAKVILTVRDPDSWYQSMRNTIFLIHSASRRDPSRQNKPKVNMVGKIILDGAFDNPDLFNDEVALKAKFVEHNERVKRIVPKERLLVMQLGEGWDRLCDFLDVPVPSNVDYPNVNKTSDMRKRFPELTFP
ncbi:P-loop containing nucleoside triphosphate hydrolase protein [Zychaea mexicana]|uniref:P-loop containing nucleoside triphosphate hydrolase protein n=1 Tax=Zychaea mexicana TaxID=64656 RepID=UPI0022FE51D9|nr:P-loop containing nucleoside triphosphate hydrolase protein [Zychaea mexicana]KAI9494355.1 P-loop containing nucleoside triphosphate hydrolase protein [Zychaea mexicana]